MITGVRPWLGPRFGAIPAACFMPSTVPKRTENRKDSRTESVTVLVVGRIKYESIAIAPSSAGLAYQIAMLACRGSRLGLGVHNDPSVTSRSVQPIRERLAVVHFYVVGPQRDWGSDVFYESERAINLGNFLTFGCVRVAAQSVVWWYHKIPLCVERRQLQPNSESEAVLRRICKLLTPVFSEAVSRLPYLARSIWRPSSCQPISHLVDSIS